MGRTPARAVLGGMARLQGEADATVVEEDPGLAGHQMRTEIKGVGLGERDPETVGVDGTQMRGVPVGEGGRARPGCASGGCGDAARSRSMDAARGSRPLESKRVRHHRHRHRGPRDGRSWRRGPPRRSGVATAGRCSRPGSRPGLGDPGPGQREISLRGSRDRPQVMAERRQRQAVRSTAPAVAHRSSARYSPSPSSRRARPNSPP